MSEESRDVTEFKRELVVLARMLDLMEAPRGSASQMVELVLDYREHLLDEQARERGDVWDDER